MAKPRADPALRRRVNESLDAHTMAISTISIYELHRWFGSLRGKGEGMAKISDTEHLVSRMRQIPVGEDVAKSAALLHSDAAHRGALIADADVLIAATALAKEGVLITTDAALVRNLAKATTSPPVELYPANVAAS